MKKLVHIALSDSGWILERLAREVESRMPEVSFGPEEDRRAPIQYYVTYGRRVQRVSPVEVMLFTHLEQDPTAAARFHAAANDCEAAVAMSRATADILAKSGVRSHLISPGVDLDRFRPRLKIAVVGRTYHTGRKGEALVNAVMDIPDIDWHFTGAGWPGAASPVPESELPELYRSADYVLVPALNEGGPMCVLESLACGTPVIGADVGWVPDFPHIAFEKGNAESLRRVLEGLIDDKRRLASSVKDMTWDRWAQEHDRLFHALAREHRIEAAPVAVTAPERRLRSVAVATHGSESTVLGGPSVRVPRTAAALSRLGLQARALNFPSAQVVEHQVVHGFNLWPPISAVNLARQVTAMGKPLVFSPILLDLGGFPLWHTALSDAFREADTLDDALASYEAARKSLAARADDALLQKEPEPGFLDALREVAERSSAFIFLSEHERALAGRLTPQLPPLSRIVHNPVDAQVFGDADPELFRQTYGLQDYVLCVGRIEHRKNQLLLAAALRELDLPLVLVGHDGEPSYGKWLRKFGGPRVLHIDRLEPASPLLRSAMAGARVFTLPSWAEGAPLAALEAAAAGANLVLSERSSEREYFGDMARYCDPADLLSMRDQIAAAWDQPRTADERRAQQQHVADSYSWERYAESTRDVYAQVLAAQPPARTALRPVSATADPAAAAAPVQIVFDITTLANNRTTRSGIVRVEWSLARELAQHPGADARFVVWHSPNLGYLEIPKDVVLNNLLAPFLAGDDAAAPARLLPRGAHLVVVGSSWMQNGQYAESVSEIAARHGLKLAVMMHDFTPVLFPYWYPEGYAAPFERNMSALLRPADRVLVYSENSRADLVKVSHDLGLEPPPVERVRLADEIGGFGALDAEPAAGSLHRWATTPFILAVGGIHARKNYGLLIDCWRELSKDEQLACPHLLIVGGVSWNGAEQARAIREDKRLSRVVHILADVDDGGLDWLYRHCLFTVYPSLYEGWGLPVAESMSYGKLCLAANTSSVPEVAPGLAVLLDPTDRKGWVTAIRHYAGSATARAAREALIREQYTVTRWADTADTLLRALRTEVPPRERFRYTLGQLVPLTAAAGPSPFRLSGWYPREEWGSWASEPAARLRVQLTCRPTEDLVFEAVARMFARPGQTKVAHVDVNGQRVASWTFFGATAEARGKLDVVCAARIPAALCPEDGVLDIELVSASMEPIRAVNPASQDTRTLGLGVSAFSVQLASRAMGFPGTIRHWRPLSHLLRGDDLQRSPIRPPLPLNRWFFPEPLTTPVPTVPARHEGRSAVSQGSWVRVRGGLSSLRLGADLELEAMIRCAPLHEQGMTVSLMVDHRTVGSWLVQGRELQRVAMRVPAALLGRRDPIEIAFFAPEGKLLPEGAALHPLAPGCFEVLKLRIGQDAPAPVVRAELKAGEPWLLDQERIAALLDDGALDSGWQQPEVAGIWSLGNEGRLLLRGLAEPGAAALVDLSWPAAGEGDDAVEVSCNGRVSVLAAQVEQPTVLRSLIAVALPEAPAGEPVDIDLHLRRRTLAEPGTAASQNDPRLLGVHLHGLERITLHTLPMAQPMSPTTLEEGSLALLRGWHDADDYLGAEVRWSSAPQAELVLRLPCGPGEGGAGGRLLLRLLPLVVHGGEAGELQVLINGHVADRERFTAYGLQTVAVDLQPGWLGDSGLVTVGLATALAIPAEIGLGADQRQIGVALASVEFVR